ELSRRRLWPPPHPLKEGKAVKYVKNGVEVWIYQWDYRGVKIRVIDEDKSFTITYGLWGAYVVEKNWRSKYAESFKKLGVSTEPRWFTADVRELLQEAVSGGEAVAKAVYEKRLRAARASRKAEDRGCWKRDGGR
ncbi:MAG: hypothetical protein ABWK05_04950, partial [Pyrobaculum sp.]